MQLNEASILQTDPPDRFRVQPLVSLKTYRIMRMIAADRRISFGELVDEWAAAAEAASKENSDAA
jgi:hypothetical protein